MARLNRFAAILTLLGFLAVALGPLIPAVSAGPPPCAMTMGGSSPADDQPDTSKSMPVCDGNLSCIIMIGVPGAVISASTPVIFHRVRYWPSAAAMAGLNIPPDPSPPRSS